MSSNVHHSEVEYRELLAEHHALKRKLESKVEALLLVSEELGHCQTQLEVTEKKLSEALCQNKMLTQTLDTQQLDKMRTSTASEEQQQNLLLLLRSLKGENSRAEGEMEILRQRLADAEGDAKILRKQLAQEHLRSDAEKQRRVSERSEHSCGDPSESTGFSFDLSSPPEPCSSGTKGPVWPHGKELLEELEKVKGEQSQMESDLKSLLCEKEELVLERDDYKRKCERLNKELSLVLHGEESGNLDVDMILMENKYLKEQLKNAKEENGLTKASLSKYKSLIERGRKPKNGQDVKKSIREVCSVLTPRQVQELLSGSGNSEGVDFKALSTALLEAVNDKSLALTHQKKANNLINKLLGLHDFRILATRVNELEAKLKTLELSPSRICDENGESVSQPVGSSLVHREQEETEPRRPLPELSSESEGWSEKSISECSCVEVPFDITGTLIQDQPPAYTCDDVVSLSST